MGTRYHIKGRRADERGIAKEKGHTGGWLYHSSRIDEKTENMTMRRKPLRTPKSDEILRLHSDTLYYEAWMLNESATFLRYERENAKLFIYNAVLESFVLHMRTLIDFLYADPDGMPPKDDDIVATDYIGSAASIPTLPSHVREWKEKANKLAAHITYTRQSIDKEWPYILIVNEINSRLRSFIDRLPPTRTGDMLRKLSLPSRLTEGTSDNATSGTSIGTASVLKLCGRK